MPNSWFTCRNTELITMPKKKTGARKKAEKQKERQRDIRNAHHEKSLADRFCNQLMVRPFLTFLNVCKRKDLLPLLFHWYQSCVPFLVVSAFDTRQEPPNKGICCRCQLHISV